MKRTPDSTMGSLRSAAQQFASVGPLPDSLRGEREGETEDRLLQIQAAVGEQLVRHAHAAGSVSDLVSRVKADGPTREAIARVIPGVSLDEATSVALRVCAGCIDGAKVPRDEEMTVDAHGRATT